MGEQSQNGSFFKFIIFIILAGVLGAIIYFYQNPDTFEKLFGISIGKPKQEISPTSSPKQSQETIATINPCLNGGKIDNNGNCICPVGYFGKRCETAYNSFNTCQNRGDPTFDKDNNFKECKCDAGFIGKNCEFSSEVCNNRGDPLLIDANQNFDCKCDPGYFGKICQYSRETCNNRGNPVLDENKNFVKCECDPNTG